jgi:hypothetical protein
MCAYANEGRICQSKGVFVTGNYNDGVNNIAPKLEPIGPQRYF